jgi:hypothetical protein
MQSIRRCIRTPVSDFRLDFSCRVFGSIVAAMFPSAPSPAPAASARACFVGANALFGGQSAIGCRPDLRLRVGIFTVLFIALCGVASIACVLEEAISSQIPRESSFLAVLAPTAAPATTSLACVALLRSRVEQFAVLELFAFICWQRGIQRHHLRLFRCNRLTQPLPLEFVLFLLTYLPPRFKAYLPACQSLGLLRTMYLLAFFDEEGDLSGDAWIGIDQN